MVLPPSESEEDEECAVVAPPRLPTGVAVRKKSRVSTHLLLPYPTCDWCMLSYHR